MPRKEDPEIGKDEALVIVDVQNDFLPGGALAVDDGDAVIPVLNEFVSFFMARKLPAFATADWHPADHCSFAENGGPWPSHCVADSPGAQFAEDLDLPDDVRIVRKGTAADQEAYSGFQGTDLADQLHAHAVRRILVGGLTTDYCVLNTVIDALTEGFEVVLLSHAMRAVNLGPGDGARALESMLERGATTYAGSVAAD